MLGQLEDHGHRAHRLRKAAGARRLLADAPTAERHGLVSEPCRLATHTNLDEDEVGAGEGGLELPGDLEPSLEPLPLQHPPREPPNHVAAARVDVVQSQLVERQIRQPRHELRRVGGPCPDHRNLHPFTPVRVTPSMNALWAAKKSAITGAMNSSVAAIVRFHCTWCTVRN